MFVTGQKYEIQYQFLFNINEEGILQNSSKRNTNNYEIRCQKTSEVNMTRKTANSVRKENRAIYLLKYIFQNGTKLNIDNPKTYRKY